MKTIKKVFEPITINSLVLPNRMVVSAMLSAHNNPDGTITERFIRYLEEKAKGGWGLIISGDYLMKKGAGGIPNIAGIWDDKFIPDLHRMTDRVHAAGGRIFCQLFHAGRTGSKKISGEQIVAPSAIREVSNTEVPRELTIPEIKQLVEEFGEAALRAKKAGFDGVEIHGASGYLVGSFCSPYSNKRGDEYGGTIAGRAKFSCDIIKCVREKVGPDFPISYRMTTQEYVDGGLGIVEAQVIAGLIEDAGADMIHCTQGVYDSRPVITPPYPITKGSYADNAAEIKKVVSIPVLGVAGRVNDPRMAEALLLSGKMDMVTMARASLADPQLPKKAERGDFDDINQCIGCVQGCQGGLGSGGISCLVNPMIGREYKYSTEKVVSPKTIYVAGGGLAGCEFAFNAAMRGHKVTLFEKTSVLGGQWRAASRPVNKSEYMRFIYWQKLQMEKYGVTVHMQTELTKELVLVDKPDVVVVATGNTPFIPPVPGLEERYVLARDVLEDKVEIEGNVVVIGGGLVGCEAAEFAASRGCKTTILELNDSIATDAVFNPRKLLLESLAKYGVDVYVSAKTLEITDHSVIFDLNGTAITIENVGTIIAATGGRPNHTLADELSEYDGNVICLGDASSLKDGLKNIREAFEMAMEI